MNLLEALEPFACYVPRLTTVSGLVRFCLVQHVLTQVTRVLSVLSRVRGQLFLLFMRITLTLTEQEPTLQLGYDELIGPAFSPLLCDLLAMLHSLPRFVLLQLVRRVTLLTGMYRVTRLLSFMMNRVVMRPLPLV